MVRLRDIHDLLAQIPDPEMPISITDLGLIESVRIEPGPDGDRVCVDVLPTFVGCPALDMIRGDIETKVRTIEGVESVEVAFLYDPPWSVDRINDAGREMLRAHGVTVPDEGGRLNVPGHGGHVTLRTSAIACPFCGSESTHLESAFGPTRCRSIHYCNACRNSFERMKRIGSTRAGSTPIDSTDDAST